VPGACADPDSEHAVKEARGTIPTQRLTFTAEAGTTYHVQVGTVVSSMYDYPANLLVTFVAGAEPAQIASTALSRMGGANALAEPALKNKGLGVGVAVLDTGIDFAHPDLQPVMNGVNCLNPGSLAADDNGHGSHVAGIIGARDNKLVRLASHLVQRSTRSRSLIATAELRSQPCCADWIGSPHTRPR
jgi:subtilisin family serine protease